MKFPFYQGKGNQTSELPAKLPVPKRAQLLKPESYLADSGLKDACNVALLLGQPLLLTGEPGTGKTQFAYSLAWELGLATPLKFETKSDSVARNLFYIYDALKRFQDIQSNIQGHTALDYINYQALGLAIIKSRSFDEVINILPREFSSFEPQRSVVLIDEVDKAPRDFPNDLLNELDQLYFCISELGNQKVEVNPELRPIIIITSNSEKDLPDAFLRRCIYYNVPFPDSKRLADIVASRLGSNIDKKDRFLEDALDLFTQLRNPQNGLRKKPATSELLGWLIILKKFSEEIDNPLLNEKTVLKTLSSLIKTKEDRVKSKGIVEKWIDIQNSRN